MPGLLIADDEDIVRDTIRSIVESAGLGLDPIGEARTGQEAVTLALQMQPDIILMDVRMPGMDGLEATRTIRSQQPGVKVIILTAYDEFAFSQEALRLGAVDYLLKPVRPSVLLEVLSRIGAQVAEEHRSRHSTAETHLRLQAALPMVEARLVHSLVRGDTPPRQMAEQLDAYLGKQISWPAVLVVAVDQHDPDWSVQPAGLLGDIVRRALAPTEVGLAPSEVGEDAGAAEPPMPVEDGVRADTGADGVGHVGPPPQVRPYRLYRPDAPTALVAEGEAGQVIVVIAAEGPLANTAHLKDLGHRIRAAVESGAPVTATVTIGRRYPTLDLVPVSYSEAQRAQWLRLCSGGNSVVHVDDMRRADRAPQPYPIAAERALLYQMRVGDLEECSRVLDELIDYLLGLPCDPPEMVHTRFAELITLTSRAAIDAGAPFEHVLEISHERIVALNGLRTGATLRAWAQESLKLLKGQIAPVAARDHIVERAVQFLMENFRRPDLQLKDVASVANVSASHLAHLLRTHVGASFVRYLTALRMEEAKRLLTETDLKVATVAGQAGYDDPTYFYRVFRRETGMTPIVYRRRARLFPNRMADNEDFGDQLR